MFNFVTFSPKRARMKQKAGNNNRKPATTPEAHAAIKKEPLLISSWQFPVPEEGRTTHADTKKIMPERHPYEGAGIPASRLPAKRQRITVPAKNQL